MNFGTLVNKSNFLEAQGKNIFDALTKGQSSQITLLFHYQFSFFNSTFRLFSKEEEVDSVLLPTPSVFQHKKIKPINKFYNFVTLFINQSLLKTEITRKEKHLH